MDTDTKLRGLPAVDRVMQKLESDDGAGPFRHDLLSSIVREVIDGLRRRVLAGEDIVDEDLAPVAVAGQALLLARERACGSLRPVINLTGVVLHTNLGRAPLSREVLKETTELLYSYNNLEFDLVKHTRGSRHDHVTRMLLQLMPAEAALIVNNNAAAVLLILSEFAAGLEVVVSRGELIEIGGGFRIPDVMSLSGARLKEVGTTNRTRVDDYENAVGQDTAMLFKAHMSNFRMVGFTEEVSYEDLASLAHRLGVMFVADLGSGRLADLDLPGSGDEPGPTDVIQAGADLVCFSGDKLMGGPQAGVIAGRSDLVARLKKNPLLRAMRVGRFTIAAMEATLKRYMAGDLDEVPVVAALTASAEQVRRRCRGIVRRVRRIVGNSEVGLDVVPTEAGAGGGTLPGWTIPSFGLKVRVKGRSETWIEEVLRKNDQPVLGRIREGCLILDMRTLLPGQEATVASALADLVGNEEEEDG